MKFTVITGVYTPMKSSMGKSMTAKCSLKLTYLFWGWIYRNSGKKTRQVDREAHLSRSWDQSVVYKCQWRQKKSTEFAVYLAALKMIQIMSSRSVLQTHHNGGRKCNFSWTDAIVMDIFCSASRRFSQSMPIKVPCRKPVTFGIVCHDSSRSCEN